MTAATAIRPSRPAPAPPLLGRAAPRIAPPMPTRHDVPGFVTVAEGMGITPMPWQEVAASYLTATTRQGHLRYREVCILVARQNGKTTLLKPYVVAGLRAGLRFLHMAQTRELPREMFGTIADALSDAPELFPLRRGRVIWPRYGSGQEEIVLANGGSYRIAASNRGGARGRAVDRLLIDELRELVDWDALSAAEPTMTMAPDPQTVYLSNAGTDDSVILNAIRTRALSGQDPSLAYLEWSAAPNRAPDDRDGWAEANPALGHYPQVLRELERSYTARHAEGQLSMFETERLCRWLKSAREPYLDLAAWSRCKGELAPPVRPAMAVSMDPSGRRASAAISWRQADDTIALRLLYDVPGDPIDTDLLGRDLRADADRLHITTVGLDPMTDAALGSHFRKLEPVAGPRYANASARFVAVVEAGRLRWDDCAAVTDDLTWTARKAHNEKGAFEAVRGNDARPITAALAAIRAVWLASSAPPPRRPATFRSF